MVLSDKDIKKAIDNDEIIIDPYPDENQFESSALDLKLRDNLYMWKRSLTFQGLESVVDIVDYDFTELADEYLEEVDKNRDGTVTIPPNTQFPILGMTREYIDLPMDSLIAARVEGRSSLGRLGLFVHVSAPTIHLDYDGHITLEFYNIGPFHIKLKPREARVCQLVLERVESKPTDTEDGQFRGQEHPSGN